MENAAEVLFDLRGIRRWGFENDAVTLIRESSGR
ncbi:MAG: hypothetical protein JWR14_4410 [Caballeronia sp.]|jgi:hypothetical protein|nr:hypothetical protein [Caballeronia sp.]